MRRENELYRVIETFGGIANIHTREFFDAHMTLIETMIQAGEPTSAPLGARIDKRTASTTVDNMKSRGRIKMLKTSVITQTGVSRPACIVYLPNIEQDKLNAFLTDLSRAVPTPQPQSIKTIGERIDYGSGEYSTPRSALPLQLLQMEQPGANRKERWCRNTARAAQLFSYDDNTIREVLLTERTTVAQLYGFIVAKAMRARELHLYTLNEFERSNPSSNIVSVDRRIIHLSYYCHDLPVSTYCSFVSCLTHDEELARFLETEGGRKTPVRDLPPNLHSALQVGRSRTRSRFLDTLELLRSLKLVTPLQPSDSNTPWITCVPNGEHSTSFDIATLDGWSANTPMVAPVYWHFNTMAPLYLWGRSESSPPFWKNVNVSSYNDSEGYWRDLRDACTNTEKVEVDPNFTLDGAAYHLDVSLSTARSLRRGVSWSTEYVLTWHQAQYLRCFADVSTASTPLQDEQGGEAQMTRISWVISAPRDAVHRFFAKSHAKMALELERARRKAQRQSTGKKARNAAEAKALLSKKAADAKLQRGEDWDNLVRRIHPEPLKGSVAVRMRQLRSRFLQSGPGKDVQKWETEITAAIREATMAAKKVLKVTNRPSFPKSVPPKVVPLATASNPPEKSIATLISEQGPPIRQNRSKPKPKRKPKEPTNGAYCSLN